MHPKIEAMLRREKSIMERCGGGGSELYQKLLEMEQHVLLQEIQDSVMSSSSNNNDTFYHTCIQNYNNKINKKKDNNKDVVKEDHIHLPEEGCSNIMATYAMIQCEPIFHQLRNRHLPHDIQTYQNELQNQCRSCIKKSIQHDINQNHHSRACVNKALQQYLQDKGKTNWEDIASLLVEMVDTKEKTKNENETKSLWKKWVS